MIGGGQDGVGIIESQIGWGATEDFDDNATREGRKRSWCNLSAPIREKRHRGWALGGHEKTLIDLGFPMRAG